MLSLARWTTLLLLCTASPVIAQDKKFTLKTGATEPPKELHDSVRGLLSDKTVQFFDPAGKLVCELWLSKEVPAQATAEQIKNGITYRELKETQVIGAIRFDQAWHDYRKQNVKSGVYTMRLGFQPQDGDHSGKSEFTEFLLLSSAARDQSAEVMSAKSLQEMSGKSLNTGHPGVLMLFPNAKSGPPAVEAKGRDHWVVNVSLPVQGGGARSTLGFGITLVGEADD